MKTSKEEIIRLSTKLFIRKGYHGVNLTDIEAEVGITRGGLFYHIDNKEHIYRESLNRYLIMVEEIESKFTSIKTDTVKDFIDQYSSLLEKTMADLSKLIGPSNYSGYFSFYLLAITEQDDLIKKFDKINADQVKLWTNVIQKGIDGGELKKDLEADAVALLFRNSSFGLSYMSSVNKGLQPKQLRKMMATLYDNIKK